MKLRVPFSVCLLALAAPAFASYGSADAANNSGAGKFYLGLFGGGGASSGVNVMQYGTAYYLESQGGPFAIDASGTMKGKGTGFFGGQIGYQAHGILLNASPQWTLAPAAEMEAFSTGSNTFTANVSNNNPRLILRDFSDSFPMATTLYLANAVIGFNNPNVPVHPYVGFGIGQAAMQISNASSTLVAPLTVGNRFNVNPTDSTSAFAGQVKLGLSYDIVKYVSIFVDYRWVYVASADFIFGSTRLIDQAETSSWQVDINAQQYNLGDIGIRFSF